MTEKIIQLIAPPKGLAARYRQSDGSEITQKIDYVALVEEDEETSLRFVTIDEDGWNSFADDCSNFVGVSQE